jgi:hypothetical protein
MCENIKTEEAGVSCRGAMCDYLKSVSKLPNAFSYNGNQVIRSTFICGLTGIVLQNS